MMRIRSIRPEFWEDADLARLDLAARLLFIGLWQLADREGRLHDDDRWIAIKVFPYEPGIQVAAYLSDLEAGGFIERYEADGVHVISIPNFLKHQRVNARESESSLPPPPENPARARTCMHRKDRQEGEGKGRESKGKGKGKGKDAVTTATDPPTDPTDPVTDQPGTDPFRLSPEDREQLRERFPRLPLDVEIGRAAEWLETAERPPKRRAALLAFLGRWLERAAKDRSDLALGSQPAGHELSEEEWGAVRQRQRDRERIPELQNRRRRLREWIDTSAVECGPDTVAEVERKLAETERELADLEAEPT